MGKIIRHKWIKKDEFRTDECDRCGVIRYWDNDFQRLIYKRGIQLWHYVVPGCVLPNTKL